MKILRIFFSGILLSILLLFGFKIYRSFNISRDIKNEKKDKLKKSAEILNDCFDLENKNKRTLNDSLKLIEYCLKEYGTDK